MLLRELFEGKLVERRLNRPEYDFVLSVFEDFWTMIVSKMGQLMCKRRYLEVKAADGQGLPQMRIVLV